MCAILDPVMVPGGLHAIPGRVSHPMRRVTDFNTGKPALLHTTGPSGILAYHPVQRVAGRLILIRKNQYSTPLFL